MTITLIMVMKQLMRGMTLLTVSETVTGGGGGKLGDSLQSNTAQSLPPSQYANSTLNFYNAYSQKMALLKLKFAYFIICFLNI